MKYQDQKGQIAQSLLTPHQEKEKKEEKSQSTTNHPAATDAALREKGYSGASNDITKGCFLPLGGAALFTQNA